MSGDLKVTSFNRLVVELFVDGVTWFHMRIQ